MRRAIVFAAAVGCGLPAGARSPETASPLAIHAVDWNPRHEKLADAAGVADDGSNVVVFGTDGTASVLVDGVVVNVDHSALRGAGLIPAADGTGEWIAGLDPNGKVYRLRARKSFEPISDRYALDATAVKEVAGFGGHYVAFALANEIAIADGTNVTHYDSGPITKLAAGGLRVAGLGRGGVFTFDAQTKTGSSYPMPDAELVAVDDEGHVFVATATAIYGEANDRHLGLRYVAARPIHGLAVSHDRIWFAEGDELGVMERGGVSRTHDAKIGATARLVGSTSGDVWTIDGGKLARFTVGNPKAPKTRWEEAIAPIFARSCAQCHAQNGSAGVDLSTGEAWKTKHDLIRQRVTVDRDMPPSGHALPDLDRAAIDAWLAQ